MDFIDVEMELSAYGRDDLAEFVDAEVTRIKEETDGLRRQRDYLLAAARRTLAENGHLADGDVCTLIVLKRAVETLEEVGAGRTADSGHNLNSPTPIDG